LGIRGVWKKNPTRDLQDVGESLSFRQNFKYLVSKKKAATCGFFLLVCGKNRLAELVQV
jgi:hypothetical protein